MKRLFTAPLGALLLLLGCSQSQPIDPPTRIFLLGVDALSYERIDPLLAAGELPNLRRVIEGGVRAEPDLTRPMEPVSLWNTVLTGRSAQAHGVLGHLSQIPNGQISVTPSSARKTPQIWQLLSLNNLMSAGVGFPSTWPAETMNGFLATNVYTTTRWMETSENSFDRVNGMAETMPPGLFNEITPMIHAGPIAREDVGRFFVLNEDEYEMIYDLPLGSVLRKENPLQDFAITYLSDSSNMDVGLYLSRNYSPRFIGIYLELVQTLQSAFWPFTEPEVYGTPDENNRRFANTVDEGYRWVDEQVGRILEEMNPNDTLIIVSEHGFETATPPPGSDNAGKPFPVASSPAVLLLYGHAIRVGAEVEKSSIADVVPTILALLGKEVANNMDGTVLVDAIDAALFETVPIRSADSYDYNWPPADRYPALPGVAPRTNTP